MTLRRRPVLRAAGLLGLGLGLGLPTPSAKALTPRTLVFPRDHGAHPDLRTEWWYLTGEVNSRAGQTYGFQVTFFRSRVDATQTLRSRLAARQLLFAHAAITDLQAARLWHDERIARWNGEPHGPVQARLDDTGVRLRDWRFERDAVRGTYHAQVRGDSLRIDLQAQPTQALLLQGERGLSRKGPEAVQASHYYTQPHLRVSGELGLMQQRIEVQGLAWLDHEWSEALLHPEAVGWDWAGINGLDGGALTAFQLRRADGSALWAGGSWRPGGGAPSRSFAADEVRFEPLRHWRSPHSGARYPVEWRVHTPMGAHTLHSRLDDQEVDARGSTGNVYWEGLSELRDAAQRVVGHGYLEMTGYVQRLRL